MKVGRVIARPFVGSPEEGFRRTPRRRDFAIPPPAPTLCDWVHEAGRRVHAVGKIGDIFSMRGIDTLSKGPDRDLMGHLHRLATEAEDGSLVFANFVEFDSDYGHRRDPAGYARHLEWFDAGIGALLPLLRAGDLLLLDPFRIWALSVPEEAAVLPVSTGARLAEPPFSRLIG